MKNLLHAITDRVSTKKGMWVTLGVWFIITCLLAMFAPSAKEYEVSTIQSLPEDAKSVIAQNKIDQYFDDSEGIPAIFVFQDENGIQFQQIIDLIATIEKENVKGFEQVVNLALLPPQAFEGFISEDQSTAIIPVNFDSSLENKEIKNSIEDIEKIVNEQSNLDFYVTGPAGISADTLDLFSRADLVLLFSTIGLILVLLIIIYRSPLLALIPLLAAAFVYEVVMQVLGLMGKAGLVMSNQTISIMTILLFAAVIDYSLFVFSRFREELKQHEDKYTAMKLAMRGTGLPVFFSGGTVLAAMLVLFFAEFGDYRNFAPIFATTMVIIMISSVTLVPALFTLFGRKSFWPTVPKVGDAKIKENSIWSKIGKFVVKKPVISVALVGILLIVSASNVLNVKYEFDTMKSFPKDMPSRQGYEILGEKFSKGDLAPTTVLVESNNAITNKQLEELQKQLLEQPLVESVRLNGAEQEGKVLSLQLTFNENPYSEEVMNALDDIIQDADSIVKNAEIDGNIYFAGETAKLIDERSVNQRDVLLIVILETILIFGMLIYLTKSIKMPIYMMGTILISFLSALGLGIFLTDLFFDIDTISDRVPLYSFVFLVALGIDYNIMLISRFLEERKTHSTKKAIEIAVASTGGVISSAGIILAATFAVLMTQPIELLFVFGFIVAVGILLDTFLIRGVLLPGLITLFEKDKKVSHQNNNH